VDFFWCPGDDVMYRNGGGSFLPGKVIYDHSSQ
jgi:hypothetical protein